ncbi:MAG: rhomboid family intramembrane serine protease [Bacteroidales bacterium]|nr:rhomboid family intramembrane serine protease [Bacteroidales bacterium]
MKKISKYYHIIRNSNAVVKLIIINCLIFIIYSLYLVILFFIEKHSTIQYYFMLPSNINLFLQKPWTIFTYMFFHTNLLHIIFNMLWLYWLGTIFISILFEKRFYTVYFTGGIVGGLLFILAYNIIPALKSNAFALGASAAIMAVVICICLYSANYEIYLLFFGKVKLKYLAIVTILIDIISIPGTNSGGHIAHIGGALTGFIFFLKYKYNFNFRLYKKKYYKKNVREMNDYEYNYYKSEIQKEVDRLLDKISKEGYNSLSQKEKEFLRKFANNEI